MRLTDCRTIAEHFDYLVEYHGYVLTHGGAPRAYFRAVRIVRIVAVQMRMTVEELIELVQCEYNARLPRELRG